MDHETVFDEDEELGSEVFSKDVELNQDSQLPRKDKVKITYKAGFWDVVSFGVCLAAANLFISWSTGFATGYWDFLFATLVSGSTFICLHLCIAEMVSVLPFAGGTFALARVTAGPYVGFLVGCFESIGNIVFVYVSMMPIGTTITYIVDGDSKYEPLYWLLAYVLVIAAEFAGRQYYFLILRCAAFLCIAMVSLYLIFSAQDIHILQYIPLKVAQNTYSGGVTDFLHILPISGWFYYGIEIMPLISDEVHNGKVVVPTAIATSITIVTVFAFICMLAAYSQYPGFLDDYALSLQMLPLNSGFSNALGINDRMATLFSYFALFISNALFIFGYGKQLSAMAKSKLLPSFLGWTVPNTRIPYMALIVGSVIGYVVLVVMQTGYGYDYSSDLTTAVFNAAILGSYTTFVVMFASFIIFRYKYSNLPRSFRNPLGIAGAIYGMVGMLLLLVSVIGFSQDNYHAIEYFIVFVAILSLYYYAYARHHQVFSEEEQSVMFVVYLMKANQIKQKALKKRRFRTVRRIRDVSVHSKSSVSVHSCSEAIADENGIGRTTKKEVV